MTEETLKKLFKNIWDDIDQENPTPDQRPLLAHYTSIRNLENILRSEEIWFSHPRSMNDISEQRFGFDKFRSIINYDHEFEKSFQWKFGFSIFRGLFNQYCSLLDRGWFDNIYCFCLSEHETNDQDGKLSMWRGYGANGSGVALVIDPKKVKGFIDPSIVFARVKYPNEVFQTEWCKNIIKKFG